MKRCINILAYDLKNADNVIKLMNKCIKHYGNTVSYAVYIDYSEFVSVYADMLRKVLNPDVMIYAYRSHNGNYRAPLRMIDASFACTSYDEILRFDDDLVISDSFFNVIDSAYNQFPDADIVSQSLHKSQAAPNIINKSFPHFACHIMKRSYYNKINESGWLSFMLWLHEDIKTRRQIGIDFCNYHLKELKAQHMKKFFIDLGANIVNQDMMQFLFCSQFPVKSIRIPLPRAGVLPQTSLHLTEEGLKHITKPDELYHDEEIPNKWEVAEQGNLLLANWE